MTNTLISIIIPSYKSYSNLIDWDFRNKPDYFNEIQFIFIDSNTNELSESIFNNLTSKYNNIKFVSSNTSIYEAMNLGIEIADSKIIGFMGMDDSLHLELNHFISYLKNLNFNYDNLYVLDVEISSILNNKVSSKRIKFNKNLNYYHHQSCFFNKDFLIAEKLFYNTSYKIFSDMDFIFNVLKLCKPKFINSVGIIFTKGGKSTSGYFFRTTVKELFYISKEHNKLFTRDFILNNLRLLYYFINYSLEYIKKYINNFSFGFKFILF